MTTKELERIQTEVTKVVEIPANPVEKALNKMMGEVKKGRLCFGVYAVPETNQRCTLGLLDESVAG